MRFRDPLYWLWARAHLYKAPLFANTHLSFWFAKLIFPTDKAFVQFKYSYAVVCEAPCLNFVSQNQSSERAQRYSILFYRERTFVPSWAYECTLTIKKLYHHDRTRSCRISVFMKSMRGSLKRIESRLIMGFRPFSFYFAKENDWQSKLLSDG